MAKFSGFPFFHPYSAREMFSPDPPAEQERSTASAGEKGHADEAGTGQLLRVNDLEAGEGGRSPAGAAATEDGGAPAGVPKVMWLLLIPIEVIPYLSNSVTCKQGTAVALLELKRNGVALRTLPIRAGMETAEWAASRPDISASMQHKPAATWNQFMEFYRDIPYPRNMYSWTLKLPELMAVDSISVCLNSAAIENKDIRNNFLLL